jgi:hypothetical protein
MSLVGPDDWMHLKRIERMLGARLDRHVIEGLEPTRSEPRFERRPSSKRPPQHRHSGQRPHHQRARDFGNRADSQVADRPNFNSPRYEQRDDGRRNSRPDFKGDVGNTTRRDEQRGERSFAPRFDSRDASRGKPRREVRQDQRSNSHGDRGERTERRPEFRADRGNRRPEHRPALHAERRDEPRGDFRVPDRPERPSPRIEYKPAERSEHRAQRNDRRPNASKPRRDFAARDGNAPLSKPRVEFVD